MNATPEQAAYSACLPGAAAVHLVFGFQLSRHTVFISVSGALFLFSCPHGVPLGSIQHRRG